jgi:hypothetical protein
MTSWPIQPSIQQLQRDLSPRVKPHVRQALPPPSVDVKTDGAVLPLPTCLHGTTLT